MAEKQSRLSLTGGDILTILSLARQRKRCIIAEGKIKVGDVE